MSDTLIAGAGPAGLTAAYELAKAGARALVIEKSTRVGGISRTETYEGYRFDIGGHRFFTKVGEVEALWHEILGDDFVETPRLSRIFYDGKFYPYPLQLGQTLRNLGALESAEKGVVVDMAEVAYVSSAGLRVMLIGGKTAKAKGKAFRLAGLKPAVAEVFKMSGFDRLLESHPDVAKATG